jgi:hypothetical protein
VRFIVTDYSPTYQFYLVQRRNAPVALDGRAAAPR